MSGPSAPYPFDTTIPNAPNDPADDQPIMLQNNQSAAAIFAVDHVPFNNNFGGYHNHSTYVNQTADPTTISTEGAVYAKNVTGTTALYWVRDGSLSTVVQLTPDHLTAPIFNPTTGASWLPGNIIIQWGQATKSTGQSVSFPYTYVSAPISVTCTVFENNANRHFVQVMTISTGGFTVASRDSGGNDETNTFFWMAIGR